jgi:GNAT superfamily N-acetyltransferase
VIKAADSDRDALGFFSPAVYLEYAQKENLLVAVTPHISGAQYVGHLLYDARHSRARVLQIFVATNARGKGVARLLLDHLKQRLTDLCFISIYASVAEPLVDANAFWERNAFYVQRPRPGGKSRKRTILVRCHELSSPQLFERSGITSENPFGLDVTLQSEKPIYLLDLNVLFDLRPRRARHVSALDLFRAERHGACQLALSTELREELVRTAATAPQSDPMHTWAAIFITFPSPPQADLDRLLEELGGIVFHDRASEGRLTPNDLSDLTHLATAIHHRLAGFITNDERILDAAKQLESGFGIRVLSPLAFQRPDELSDQEALHETEASGDSIALTAVGTEQVQQLTAMLLGLSIPYSEAVSHWGALDSNERVVSRCAVMAEEKLVGYLACPQPIEKTTIVGRLAIDETTPNPRAIARLLLNKLLLRAREVAPSKVRLELAPKQVAAREIAVGLGFARSEDGTVLSKLVLNRIVVPSSWRTIAAELSKATGVRMPDSSPTFKSVDQQIEIYRPDGNRAFVPLHAIESHLSPALLCLPGRSAVITPIQRGFAEHLLEHSAQGSLLPRARANLYSERHYFSAKKTLKLFTRGTVILFYESGKDHGAAAVVAVARVQRAYLRPQDAIDRTDLNPSVLSAETLSTIGQSESKTVTAFDNLISLPNPVPLATLQRLGCGKATQLISTTLITSDQLQAILKEGLQL